MERACVYFDSFKRFCRRLEPDDGNKRLSAVAAVFSNYNVLHGNDNYGDFRR